MIAGYADFLKWAKIFGLIRNNGGGGGNLFLVDGATFDNNPVVYNNGVAGVGATLTSSNPGIYMVDGVNVVLGKLYCFKNQTDSSQNGIYVCTVVGSGGFGGDHAVFTRSTDYDSPSEISVGDVISVTGGNTQAGTAWVQTSIVTAIGSGNPITFSSYSVGVLSLNALLGALSLISFDNTLNIAPNAGAGQIDLGVRLPGDPYTPIIAIENGGSFGALQKASYFATRPSLGGFIVCSVEFSFHVDGTGSLVTLTIEPPFECSFDDVNQAIFLGFKIRTAAGGVGQIGQGELLELYANIEENNIVATVETAQTNTDYVACISFMCQIQTISLKNKKKKL